MPEGSWDDLAADVQSAAEGRPGTDPVLASIWFDLRMAEYGCLAVGAALSTSAPRPHGKRGDQP